MPSVCGVLAAVLLCLSGMVAAQTRDQRAAQHALGPHWKQIARSAGAIFAGTVLAIEKGNTPGHTVPVIQVRFRVDRPIAGVRPGQLFTLREWAGAWDRHRPMRRGQRVLVLLYPPSPLGLSGPVGGVFGQLILDPDGKVVTAHTIRRQPSGPRSAPARRPQIETRVSVLQLERAILGARQERN